MNEEQIQKLKELIKEDLKYSDLDVLYFINDDDLEEIEDEDGLRDYLTELNEDGEITNAEVIYYSNAMEYLRDNDASLNDSLEIAKEYGYNIDQLNSELLASLLMTRNQEEEFSEFIDGLKYDEVFSDE